MMAPETVVTVDHNKPAAQQAPPQQQQGALDWIKINVEYFKTQPGLLKMIELVLGILCMALGTPWASAWFVFVAVTSFITTLMWSFVYFLSIREALKIPINWVLSELISTCIETLFYFIAFIVMFTTAYGNYGRNVAAASNGMSILGVRAANVLESTLRVIMIEIHVQVFAIFNTLAYAASSYLLFQEHRSGSTAAAGAA